MSLAPRADGRDAPPEASPDAVAIPAVATPRDPGPQPGDEPLVRSATTTGIGPDEADPPALVHPVDPISTTDTLHWFG
jgi:hypothetical protein